MAFWFQVGISDKYEENELVKLPACETMDDFWLYYQYLKRPEELFNGDNIYLFKDHITPTWEDPANRQGGNYILKLKKPRSNLIWEDLVLAFVGNTSGHGGLVNGLRLKCDGRENVTVQVWVGGLTRGSREDYGIEQWISDEAMLESSFKILFNHFKTR